MAMLLDVLRGASPGPSPSESQWLEALAQAQDQAVAGMFCKRLRERHPSLPNGVHQAIAEVEREAAIAAFWWISELRGLLAGFAAARIDVLPLKGPFFAERIYGGAALRSCRDLDLLVRAQQLAASEDVLTRLGFTPAPYPDDYHRPWTRGSTTVELHFNVENPLAFNFGIEAAWARASQSEFHGQAAWKLSPDDELVFLCLHGVRHRFERLSLVMDLSTMLAERRRQGAVEPALAAGLAAITLLGCKMAERLEDAGRRCEHLVNDARIERHLEQLAERLWNELLHQPHTPLTWQTLHRFYVELEPGGWGRGLRRMRHARILATRLIDEDYSFGARLGFRKTWQVRLLRPLRLLLRSLPARTKQA